VLTSTARAIVILGAQKRLTEPEGEALLADPALTVEQQAPWKPSAVDGLPEAGAQPLMTVDRNDAHAGKVGRRSVACEIEVHLRQSPRAAHAPYHPRHDSCRRCPHE
jgi:hypothetical protein